MKNETKSKVLQWISFALAVLSMVGKAVIEIVEKLPSKEEEK